MQRTHTPRKTPRTRTAGRWAAACALTALGVLSGACSSTPRSAGDVMRTPPMTRALPDVGDDAHGAAVRELASPDFEIRTQAARALVSAGDDALPALGRAGDLRVPVAGGMQVSATRSVVQAILVKTKAPALEQHLGSPWANVRRGAAEELGRRDRWVAIPRLIERLDDQDGGVRAASASALRRLTNNFFGYRAQASLGNRRVAADRWRTWWSLEGRARMKEHELGPSAIRGIGS